MPCISQIRLVFAHSWIDFMISLDLTCYSHNCFGSGLNPVLSQLVAHAKKGSNLLVCGDARMATVLQNNQSLRAQLHITNRIVRESG